MMLYICPHKDKCSEFKEFDCPHGYPHDPYDASSPHYIASDECLIEPCPNTAAFDVYCLPYVENDILLEDELFEI